MIRVNKLPASSGAAMPAPAASGESWCVWHNQDDLIIDRHNYVAYNVDTGQTLTRTVCDAGRDTGWVSF